ncbi:hypothetical protein R1T16_00410 [Flavobacterium sp. DG1-102-2]|uniref:hypothetical protein n=1 Tax=Flavobacterium sp. DG1-102-2 TaxID=3081663 RepID=UPI002949AE8F|nr:hypothetical protein [Flavobacterium sp. DG1-102-2]MDV6166866.1 hypothetical protein [Flavobacterium sp. DG1-102-2]
MKSIKLFLVLTVLAFAGSCGGDDDTNNNGTINGPWNLVKAFAPQSGISEDIAKGDVTWKISTSAGTVVTTDKRMHPDTPEPNGMYSYPNGTHTYEVKPWGGSCEESFYTEDSNFGCIEHNGNTLILTTESTDGLRYTFIR